MKLNASAIRRALAPAAVLTLCASAGADASSPTILVLGNRTDVTPTVGLSGVQYRGWDSGTNTWGSPAAISAFNSSGAWVVARNCPTRNETAAITISRTQALTLATFDGTSWDAGTLLCSQVGESWGNRGADMIYNNNGTLIAAWWDYANARVGYRVGSTTGSFTLPTSDHVSWVTLVPRPASSQALLLVLNNQSKLYASVFNGTSWGTATEIASGLPSNAYESFAGEYFGSPSRPVVVYGQATDTTPRFRILTSGAWSAEQSISASNTGFPRVFRLVRDPASRDVLMAFSSQTTSANELSVARYSSAGWTGSALFNAASLQFADRRCFDVAFEPGGTSGLLCYAAGGTGNVRYRTYDGSAWSSEGAGSNVASTICVWGLFTGSASGEIFAMPYNTTNFLNGARWSRDPSGVGSMSSHTQLAKTLDGSQKARAFMIAGPVTALPSEDEQEPAHIVRWSEASAQQ